jgi:hypothetical protein
MNAKTGSGKDSNKKTCVAEKISALRTASYFEPFKARADLQAFDRIMARNSGEAARGDDELPDE